jgi:hypothetical protein
MGGPLVRRAATRAGCVGQETGASSPIGRLLGATPSGFRETVGPRRSNCSSRVGSPSPLTPPRVHSPACLRGLPTTAPRKEPLTPSVSGTSGNARGTFWGVGPFRIGPTTEDVTAIIFVSPRADSESGGRFAGGGWLGQNERASAATSARLARSRSRTSEGRWPRTRAPSQRRTAIQCCNHERQLGSRRGDRGSGGCYRCGRCRHRGVEGSDP